MKQRLLLLTAIGLVLLGVASGEDKATPAPANITTTVKPKVSTEGSALCKRCACDIKIQELDCRNLSMKEWFNDDEWNTLTNGDVSFVTIRLEHNNLTKVPVLKPMSVENLYLGHNLIETIENAAFKNLTNLTRLDLSYNRLTTKTLMPSAFEGMYDTTNYEPQRKLIELDLGHNELHSLDSSLFMHLPKLEVLILSANEFQRIDHSSEIAIAELYYLKTLDLSYMQLDDLPDNLLHAPRDLETLILTGNLLDELPDGLENAANLKRLTFDENPMGNMEDENVFHNMSKLEYVSISYSNDLVRIGEGAFSKLSNLKTLVLSGNPRLEYIHPKAFASATVNPIIFDYPPIEELFLHNNNLTRLDHSLLERWDKVKTIDLRENPWSCDCDNSWLIKVLVKQINDTAPKLAEDVLCGSPIAWKSKPLTEITMETTLRCIDGSHPENDGRLLIGLMVGILVGIPVTLGALIAYRRGCFGLVNRGSLGSSQYNRASFNEDFHI